MWPQCGAETDRRPEAAGASGWRELPPKKYCQADRPQAYLRASKRLTTSGAEAYIRRSGRAAAWRDGASAKPLTVHTVTEHPAMLLLAMFASLCRM